MDEAESEFSRMAGKLRRFSKRDRRLIRKLREDATKAETRLWELIRNRRILGLNFRRQHKIGRFVTDFFCIKCRLAVEMDGAIHLYRAQKDEARTRWLETLGIRVLRFSNRELFRDPGAVLGKIESVARERSGG